MNFIFNERPSYYYGVRLFHFFFHNIVHERRMEEKVRDLNSKEEKLLDTVKTSHQQKMKVCSEDLEPQSHQEMSSIVSKITSQKHVHAI